MKVNIILCITFYSYLACGSKPGGTWDGEMTSTKRDLQDLHIGSKRTNILMLYSTTQITGKYDINVLKYKYTSVSDQIAITFIKVRRV